MSDKTKEIDDFFDDEFDDLNDDYDVPNDMEDFLDDSEESQDIEDDTLSTVTSMSTGSSSVRSGSPTNITESLDTLSIASDEQSIQTPPKLQLPSMLNDAPMVVNANSRLKRSLFMHVPPSINFVKHNEVPQKPLPNEVTKLLQWKISPITPAVMRRSVANTGFQIVNKNASQWDGTWGKHMKSNIFKETIGEDQKINHLPGTHNLGRKDRLWKNYHKMRLRHGKEIFNFLPRTFCLPADEQILKKVWAKRGVKAKWIIKPPAVRFF